MLPLRHPRVWTLLGWGLVVAVVVGSLVPAGLLRPLTVALSDKVLHAGSYCLLMMWFGGLYPRNRHPLVAVALLALGTGLDLLQLDTATRRFELADIAADAVGILIGLALSMTLLEGWCQRLERGLGASAG
jgi:VanZ family protein